MPSYWEKDAARTAHGGSQQRVVRRRQMLSKLKEQVDWIDKKDPKREHANMQGARYAYLQCAKWIQKNL